MTQEQKEWMQNRLKDTDSIETFPMTKIEYEMAKFFVKSHGVDFDSPEGDSLYTDYYEELTRLYVENN